MITTANYIVKAVVDGEVYIFPYDDLGDVWEALDEFYHEDYPEVLIDKGGGLFPIDVIAMDGGKAIRKYEFEFNAGVFHAFFDKGHTASGTYTLDQFAKDIERKKEPVIYRQLRRKSASGEIETFPIVSENYDDMDELCEKLNKFTGCDGEFHAIPWDASRHEWEELQKIFFVVGGDAMQKDQPSTKELTAIMDRWAGFCYNHPPYDEVILWMVGGSKTHYLYQHFCAKFSHLCDVCHDDTMGAWMKFYRYLDSQWAERLMQYVYCEWKKNE